MNERTRTSSGHFTYSKLCPGPQHLLTLKRLCNMTPLSQMCLSGVPNKPMGRSCPMAESLISPWRYQEGEGGVARGKTLIPNKVPSLGAPITHALVFPYISDSILCFFLSNQMHGVLEFPMGILITDFKRKHSI